MSTDASTVVHALLAAPPTQPLITFYDDATGERVELSGATLGNWVAKTANLLVDGQGLAPGEVAAVRLPPHWLTAAVLLGCWVAGLRVDLTGEGAGADGAGAGGADGAAVAFVAGDVEPPAADEVFALSLAPLGMPFRGGPPAGTLDFSVEVRQYGDRMPPVRAEPGQVAIADGTTHAGLLAAAVGRGVPRGTRVLVDGDAHPDPVAWLLAPLVAGAPVVLCRHLDPALLDARLAAERAIRWP
jgi:uncharacterized protein (TIGR03089 family)